MQLFVLLLTFLSFLLQILASPIPTTRTGTTVQITRFIERKPTGIRERLGHYVQGMMNFVYTTKVEVDGKDIFLERELEGTVYISVPGLPPPEYSGGYTEILGVDEQRKMVMEMAGLHRRR
ncbi:hypothetical protein PM082_006217 [Marasmius tenuissimus]|nr:hypothetical protein PM082_006217 [Marasmius tenuissimus]